MNDKEYLTWDEFDVAIEKMAEEYRSRGLNCTGVFGIPRGGLPLAVALSHRLNLPLMLHMNKSLLLVDDIADKGTTLSAYKFFDESPVFTIHYHRQSVVVPDFWVYEKTDKWIVYPWETNSDERA
jgi:hypoxanthine phosphoribosyltransferase